MFFGHNIYPKTIEEHLDAIANLLKDEKTLLFLDTNILAYLYKLHDAARQEFYDWAEPLVKSERLKIPMWSAQEYAIKVKDGKLKEYTTNAKDSKVIEKLDELFSQANLVLDEKMVSKLVFNCIY